MLFDIRNTIVSLFRNGFIDPLQYQSTVKLEQKSKPEQSVGKRTKLRRKRFDEIAKKENTIDSDLFNYYFKYSGPRNMYKKWNEEDTENNQVKVDFVKDDMTQKKFYQKKTLSKKDYENASKDDVGKTEKMNKIADIVELILCFNNEDQEGGGLKTLTLSQMLSRLPISLAQLKAGNNSEKLKNEIRQLLYSCTDQKKLEKISAKIWLTLFKHRKNLHEH